MKQLQLDKDMRGRLQRTWDTVKEKQIWILEEHSQRLQANSRTSRCVAFAMGVFGAFPVYLTENDKLHGAQMPLHFLRANFHKHYFVEQKHLTGRYVHSTKY